MMYSCGVEGMRRHAKEGQLYRSRGFHLRVLLQ